MNESIDLSASPLARRAAITRIAAAVAAATMPLRPRPAHAHTDKPHSPKAGPPVKEQKDWGIGGDAKRVNRSIAVGMADTMRFTPERIEVHQGETLKFVVRNTGKVMHEFVIGTKAENARHAEMMVKFPNMEHDEPYMAHVPPGKTGEIVWTFNRSGEFEFACLIAGHYQSGMVGTIMVTPAGKA
jgi:uncharacterized cupredoxin-like copper-binding protein